MRFSSFAALTIYKALTAVVAPLGACFIAYKKRRDPPYGKRITELLGWYSQKEKNCIWFHGASVGEINSLKPLVEEFKLSHPDEKILLSTMTTTGEQSAQKIQGVTTVFSPLDSPLAVRRFFKRFKPKILVIIDTELWPNLLDRAYKCGCPVIIVNARMQEKNCQKYLKHRELVRDLISSKLTRVSCITENDKSRYVRIGVDEGRVCVSGNMKYDLKPNESMFQETNTIKKTVLGDSVFGAISIHEGEEKAVIDAYLEARKELPELKLVFVPRHQSCGDKACEYLKSLSIGYAKRSQLTDFKDLDKDILIGDSMGEIERYLGLCDLVFMGGSLIDIGGHNPLEPAFFSLPIVTGPAFYNFKEQFDKLTDAGGAFVADDVRNLSRITVKLLSNKELLIKTGIQALDIQQQGKGAISRTLCEINRVLSKSSA
ncbi:MAG: 3-deoxy-D-manno-octulosonic acid transferase [Succinivibrio sp.]